MVIIYYYYLYFYNPVGRDSETVSLSDKRTVKREGVEEEVAAIIKPNSLAINIKMQSTY